MSTKKVTGVPVCTWVEVVDPSGRTHMEARWTLAPARQAVAA